ncbi:integration host factor subunit beta [candidate division KSB1 bacterium]|nr:integration host factor subunit beta [candidate division KSB1 bacterium]
MTKTDIIEILSKGTGLTQNETAAVVDGFLSTVTYALKNGERVELRGFGTFCLRERKEKQTPNPKTGKMMFIPHRIVPDFKPSGHMKAEVLKALKESGQFKSHSEKPKINEMGELELFDLNEQLPHPD